MIITHFPPPLKRVEYVSMGQSVRNNGMRHYQNALRHAANGNKEFAWGSYKKAKRNWHRADEIDAFMRRPLWANAAYETMKRNIEANLYGLTI